eukprot:TRINITY_DN78390_c0_g1_i1.p1 TRINITY_DN78390_c0_g1~~TRINITY_DN78390_c0_g1_i1.p1  ORF type:complete len:163 (+),score=30.12 TRINITY_DN78390_c0_g1_i1:90-578(+)
MAEQHQEVSIEDEGHEKRRGSRAGRGAGHRGGHRGGLNAGRGRGFRWQNLLRDETRFTVAFDCRRYPAEALVVKVFENQLLINGSYESQNEENGFVKETMERKLNLPNDIRKGTIRSFFTKRGFLVVTAEKKLAKLVKNPEGKIVPIKVIHDEDVSEGSDEE